MNAWVSGAIALVDGRVGTTPLRAQGIEEKTQVCAGCHGEDGKPIDKTIPTIWGQQAGYIYIQLRDFKRGDRKSEIMQPIVSSLGARRHAGDRRLFLEKAVARSRPAARAQGLLRSEP